MTKAIDIAVWPEKKLPTPVKEGDEYELTGRVAMAIDGGEEPDHFDMVIRLTADDAGVLWSELGEVLDSIKHSQAGPGPTS